MSDTYITLEEAAHSLAVRTAAKNQTSYDKEFSRLHKNIVEGALDGQIQLAVRFNSYTAAWRYIDRESVEHTTAVIDQMKRQRGQLDSDTLCDAYFDWYASLSDAKRNGNTIRVKEKELPQGCDRLRSFIPDQAVQLEPLRVSENLEGPLIYTVCLDEDPRNRRIVAGLLNTPPRHPKGDMTVTREGVYWHVFCLPCEGVNCFPGESAVNLTFFVCREQIEGLIEVQEPVTEAVEDQTAAKEKEIDEIVIANKDKSIKEIDTALRAKFGEYSPREGEKYPCTQAGYLESLWRCKKLSTKPRSIEKMQQLNGYAQRQHPRRKEGRRKQTEGRPRRSSESLPRPPEKKLKIP